MLRGALGTIAKPPESRRPSGLGDPPRPFVLRAAHLDGKQFAPGETFAVNVHIFDLKNETTEALEQAFADWVRTGVGPGRGGVEWLGREHDDVALDLSCGPAVSKCSLLFRTPTELKGNPAAGEAPFSVLFARVRDRISTLRSLYGEGALPVDFQALGERASLVRTVHCELQYKDVRRRSSRTGAVHGIGGVTGRVDYEGDLAEFLPWLRAAWWTGVGRHTVWGNGVIEVIHAE